MADLYALARSIRDTLPPGPRWALQQAGVGLCVVHADRLGDVIPGLGDWQGTVWKNRDCRWCVYMIASAFTNETTVRGLAEHEWYHAWSYCYRDVYPTWAHGRLSDGPEWQALFKAHAVATLPNAEEALATWCVQRRTPGGGNLAPPVAAWIDRMFRQGW